MTHRPPIRLYVPGERTEGQDSLRYLDQELHRISEAITLSAPRYIVKHYEVPGKPRDGQIELADGVSWNPGSGRGLYWYDAVSATWKFLG